MTFDEIICNPEPIVFLKNQFILERIPHAQIFTGPQGNGSMAAALAFAQLLLCEEPNRELAIACQKCSSCKQVSLLIHPDLHFAFPKISDKDNKSNSIEKAFREAILQNPYMDEMGWLEFLEAQNKQLNISAESVRQIIEGLSLKSFDSSAQVMIIWLPEYLGDQGNILLKLIEEPNKDSYLILVSHNLEKILPTILSRCQTVSFEKISSALMVEKLSTMQGLDGERLKQIALVSDGNWDKALRLSKQEEENPSQEFIAWTRICWTLKASTLNEWIESFAKRNRESQKNFFDGGLSLFYEILHIKFGNELPSKLSNTEKETAAKMADRFTLKQIESIVKQITDIIYHLEANANPKVLLTDASIQMHKILTAG